MENFQLYLVANLANLVTDIPSMNLTSYSGAQLIYPTTGLFASDVNDNNLKFFEYCLCTGKFSCHISTSRTGTFLGPWRTWCWRLFRGSSWSSWKVWVAQPAHRSCLTTRHGSNCRTRMLLHRLRKQMLHEFLIFILTLYVPCSCLIRP